MSGPLCCWLVQGDRTHAMVIPVAYLAEFQQVIQDYQKSSTARPLVSALPHSLLADLAKVVVDPRCHHRVSNVRVPWQPWLYGLRHALVVWLLPLYA